MTDAATNPDFDGIWKDALTRWQPDCVELFWPDVHAQVDWHAAPVLLDKELQSLRKINKRGVRHVDHFSCAILLDRTDVADTESYRAAVGSNELLFTFPVINLAKWAAQADELHRIAPANPFAVVILAQLACRATQASAESRLVSKLELAKLLKYWGYYVGRRINLLRIIDSLLILPQVMEDAFMTS
ncbi:hypothetical protein [Pusillimonas sp. NJUB218]|uniref:hypothetical protein n=1 Tax=Pusillimonas sp. NJUB218 TaxID=2023230 RepID=UPI000F4AFE1D|nr:hypothetical protein [Pusillimonas sp. NJUB218]ROT44313.1 hypothetical protein CHR62_13425 [Pusillimonas sp. NJUB218]